MELVTSLSNDESITTNETNDSTINTNTSTTNNQSIAIQQYNDTIIYLDGPAVYSCAVCRTHLTTYDTIVSKSFHGRNGRAYLFNNGGVINITVGPAEERRLITGLHTVADISCTRCNTVIGWTYHKAYESTQKYKEGKYIIEKIHLFYETQSTPNNTKDDETIISPFYTSPPPTSHGILLSSNYKDYEPSSLSRIGSSNHNHYHQYDKNIMNTNSNNEPIIYEY